MYKVFIKNKNKDGRNEVDPTTRTITPDRNVAKEAFYNLRFDDRYYNTRSHLTMIGPSGTIFYHRFDKEPGDADHVTALEIANG